jgi:hypothetical protein
VVNPYIPVVTTHPANRAVCVGSNTSFTVFANGATGYQWQVLSGISWINVTGATAPNFDIVNASAGLNNNVYRVIVFGVCGSSTISNTATLTVNQLPNIILTATPRVSLLPTQTTGINATGTPAGGSYAWFFNNSLLTTVTGNSLSPITINGLGNYKVAYTDLNNCTATASINIVGTPSLNFWIYPNPSTGRFQVRFYNYPGENIYVVVSDRLGQTIFKQKVIAGNQAYYRTDVNLNGVPNGYYLVKIVEARNGFEFILNSRQILINH